MIYVDTSALAKILVSGAGSSELRTLFDAGAELISSRLLTVELHAVAQRRNIPAVQVREVLAGVSIVSLTDEIAARAVDLRSGLRTLDSLHLATAVTLGAVVDEFLSYDADLNAAALDRGIRLHPLGS